MRRAEAVDRENPPVVRTVAFTGLSDQRRPPLKSDRPLPSSFVSHTTVHPLTSAACLHCTAISCQTLTESHPHRLYLYTPRLRWRMRVMAVLISST